MSVGLPPPPLAPETVSARVRVCFTLRPLVALYRSDLVQPDAIHKQCKFVEESWMTFIVERRLESKQPLGELYLHICHVALCALQQNEIAREVFVSKSATRWREFLETALERVAKAQAEKEAKKKVADADDSAGKEDPFALVEGAEDRDSAYPCPNPRCPSHVNNKIRTDYMTLQTRSSDEPSTVMYWCLYQRCKKEWRE